MTLFINFKKQLKFKKHVSVCVCVRMCVENQRNDKYKLQDDVYLGIGKEDGCLDVIFLMLHLALGCEFMSEREGRERVKRGKERKRKRGSCKD